jgi:formylglycine-generating enzyme required for sulfatase activity
MDVVPVRNPGNPNNYTGYGSVGYSYWMGKYEVTNDQYCEFLNAVARSDTYGLYNRYDYKMDPQDERGGIVQTQGSGGYEYTVKANMGNKPVNYVDWYDALRFVNWMQNGQPSGAQGALTTETGVYTLTGPTSVGPLPTHSDLAHAWVLPTENEWYKAAYHKNDGATGNYWVYATCSNTTPTEAIANGTGDIANPGANVVNYDSGADWNGLNGNVTTVGSAGPLSAGPYGTFDQNGNVWEWTEVLISGVYRGNSGGSWHANASFLEASYRYPNELPTDAGNNVGFRLAYMPEPCTLSLLALGALALLRHRRTTSS